jgi:hypothetical protein
MASTLARFESSEFFLVGTPKTLACSTPVEIKEALRHLIVDACQTIYNYPGIFERMRWFMMRSLEACVESHEKTLLTYLWS